MANKRHQRHPPGPQPRVETATPHTITPTASKSPGASSTSTRGPHHPPKQHKTPQQYHHTLTTSDTSSTLRQEWRGESPTTRTHPTSLAPSPSDRHHRRRPPTYHPHQRHRPLTQKPHSLHKRHQPEHRRQHSRPTLKNTTESTTVDRKPPQPQGTGPPSHPPPSAQPATPSPARTGTPTTTASPTTDTPTTAATHQSRHPPSMPPTNAAPRTTPTPETCTSTPGRAVNGNAAHGTAYTHHRHHHPARGQEPLASQTASTSTDTTNTTTAGQGLPTIQEHLHHQQSIHHPRHPTIANATAAPITPPPPEATWATPPIIYSTLATTATSGPQTLRPNDQKQHPHCRHHRQHHIRPYVTRAVITNHHLVIRGTNTTGDDDSDNS